MRAREPDRDGFAERDGVKLAYEVFGDEPGRPTIALLPTWQVVHSRHWKAQVPYLARHFRVVTFDGRGTGRSSRPAGAASYTDLECAADVVAVLDATGTDRAVLVAPVVRVDLGCPRRRRPPRPGRRHRRPRPLVRARRRPAAPRVVRLGRRARHDRGMGEVQPALLVGGRLRRLRPLLLRPDVLRAPLDQADRGHDRVGPRDRARHPGRRHRRPAGLRRGRVRLDRGGMWACHVPGARRPRRQRPHPHRRGRPAAGRAHRRIVRVAGRQRARTSRPRPGADQRADPRLRRVPPPAGAPGGHDMDPRRFATPAGALSVLPHRPRARPARPRHRPGAAHPPPRPADRLARTGPRDPGAHRRRRVGPPRVLVVGQRDGPHRRRGGRARPPRLPGHPAHGRDPRRQLRRVP